MKTRTLPLLLAACLAAIGPRAEALVTYHGGEPLRTSAWSDGLTALVNHPARVGGMIGPLAPSARLHFSGDAAVFNQILAQYGQLEQKPRVVYLHAEAAPRVAGFKEDESHDFDLSITHHGDAFLHLHPSPRIPLSEIVLPAGVTFEVMPLSAAPLDPEERRKLEAEQKRLEAFVAGRKARTDAAKVVQPGAIAPRV